MFADQMGYDGNMVKNVRKMVQFVLLLYVSAWLRAPPLLMPPRNDLGPHKDLLQYHHVDPGVNEAACHQTPRVVPQAFRAGLQHFQRPSNRGPES